MEEFPPGAITAFHWLRCFAKLKGNKVLLGISNVTAKIYNANSMIKSLDLRENKSDWFPPHVSNRMAKHQIIR